MERRPIDIIISDTGPLITLAVVGRLDLLDLFQRPILIPDVVKAECLSDRTKLGYRELDQWFDESRNKYKIAETSIMDEFNAGLGKERRDPEALRHLGEKALAEVILEIKRTDETQAIAILTEDAPAGDAMMKKAGRELTILSTRGFLTGLEMKGLLDSAADILASASQKGRNVSRYNRDQPERDSKGNRITDWLQNLPDPSDKIPS